MQVWAKEHAIEQKVHLSYNLHIAGLVERKNEILKEQNKLLMSKTISAGWTKVLSQALIILNDQQVRPVTPYARLRTPTETPSATKVWKLRGNAIALTLTRDQCAMLLRTPSPITPGKGVIYWSLQWDIPPGWVSDFTPLSKEELLHLH